MPQGHPSTIGRIVERSAGRSPDRLALTFEDRRWTYAELDRAVGRVAAGLLGLGLAPGDRVAAVGKNSDAYVLLFLGCARAGLVHVPVNFNARGDELAYLLTQSQPRVAFVDPALAGAVDDVASSLEGLRRGTLRGGDGPDDVLAWAGDDGGPVHAEDGVADDDLVQLLYTSGTTSLPKGAMLTHRALVHEYVSAIVALGLSAGDVPLHSLPLYHSAQMHVFLLPSLAVGATNHLVEAPDVDDLFERVPREGIDALFLPPTVWVGVAGHPGFAEADLSSLRRAFYGASIMIYRSPQLCAGNWDMPEETEEAFAGGWFHSGDLVRIDEEGYLFVVDRIKEVINTGGTLVASREVEDALYTHPAVAEVAVVGLPHARWIEAIAAVVVLDGTAEPDELIAYARERLAGHKVPKSVHVVDELPKNASGKLLKRELRVRLGGTESAVGLG